MPSLLIDQGHWNDETSLYRSVFVIIGHYFYYWYRLFLKDVTDIVISVLITSFPVIALSIVFILMNY